VLVLHSSHKSAQCLTHSIQNHPRIRSGEADEEEQSRIDHNISTKGFAMGYVGGVILLVINVVTLTLLPTQCQPLCKDCPSDDTNICPEECGGNSVFSLSFHRVFSIDYTPEGCDNNYWGYRTNLASVGVWWFVFGM
jgi:MFS-type transporter involved in bile tolerance (Atg22 family)